MMNLAIKRKGNSVSDMADALVNIMKYSDSEVDYPSFDKAKPDDGVVAEWLYPIFNGTNDFSELTAIHLYVNQEATFEEAGELLLGIGITEMKHYDKLADFIRKLGGRIDQNYSNKDMKVGENLTAAIDIAIKAEEKTIEFYQKLYEKIEKIEETETTKIALQLMTKLIADEKVHLNLLKQYNGNERD